MKRAGFTLVEILVVLAILAVLLAVGAFSLLRSVRTAELQQAAQQVATDLREARSSAQRYNTTGTLHVTTPTGYDVRLNGATRARVMPRGTRLACLQGCGGVPHVTYRGPFGEVVTAVGTVLEVQGAAGLRPLYVKVVGVTGKVILSANN